MMTISRETMKYIIDKYIETQSTYLSVDLLSVAVLIHVGGPRGLLEASFGGSKTFLRHS